MLCVVCCLGCPVIEYMAVFSGPLSMLQPSSTVDDLSVYGDKRFQFPYSAAPGRQWILWRWLWRRWRGRRNFFRGRGWAGRVKMLAGVESKVIQFIDGVAPRREQIWRFHSCSSWNMFDLEAAGGEHRQGRRRSCDRAEASFLFLRGAQRQGRRCASGHAETFSACVVTKAFGRISPYSTCGAGLSGNLRHYFNELLFWQSFPPIHATVHGSFLTNFTLFFLFL